MESQSICNFVKYQLDKGIDLYIHPSKKFKTAIVKVFIHLPLDNETHTKAALIPNVLRRGCRRYVNMRKIVKFLGYLYGASVSVGVTKIGERQVIHFTLDVVEDKFLPQKSKVFIKALKFLKLLIANPVSEKGAFKNDYVEQEKEQLKKLIEGMINDRMTYAFEQCLREMCKGERYSIYEHGKLEDIDKITSQDLYEYHKNILGQAPIDIFIHGDFKPDKLANKVAEIFRFNRKDIIEIPDTDINIPVTTEREVIEKKDVKQGRLIIGCRTYTTWQDEDIYPMSFYSGILGAFPHSKLFVNVREKEGLAYYAGSSLEETKGLIFITAGIDFAKYQKTVEVIKAQMDDIRNGKISDTELESTRKSLIDRLRASEDHPSQKINIFLEMLINKKIEGINDIIDKLQSVTRDDVVKVAGKVKIDTIYFLTKNGIK